MLTGQQRNDIDKIWKEFWQNGMTDSSTRALWQSVRTLYFLKSLTVSFNAYPSFELIIACK